MATCPRCGRFLQNGHRCASPWLARLRAWAVLAAAGLLSAGLAWLLLTLMMHPASWAAMMLLAVVGVLVILAWLKG